MSDDSLFSGGTVHLRAHAALRQSTASPSRRKSLPMEEQQQSHHQRPVKYQTAPIKDRSRGSELPKISTIPANKDQTDLTNMIPSRHNSLNNDKPVVPPKVVNPPQAPYKKTFIAMLRGSSKDHKKRRSVECSSGGESPSPTSPKYSSDIPFNRSSSLRAPTTPPPKLLPRLSVTQTPPPLVPKSISQRSLDCDVHGKYRHQQQQHRKDLQTSNQKILKHKGSSAETTNVRSFVRPGAMLHESVQLSNNDHKFQKRQPSDGKAASSVCDGAFRNQLPSSSSNVQQSIQNFQTLQKAGMLQHPTRSGTQPNMIQSGNNKCSNHHRSRLNESNSPSSDGSRRPMQGMLTHEVQQFDSVEPLAASAHPPAISHAFVYTHPNHSPQHAIVFNPAFLSPLS